MTERTLLKRIVIDSQIMLGKPVIKGTRLPIEMIVEKMAFGKGIEALLKDYSFLEESDVRAALLYTTKSLANEEIFPA